MSLRLIRSEKYKIYPAMEEDLEQETTFNYRKIYIKFHDCRAKADTNFYFQIFISLEYRFSFTNLVSLKKSLQRSLQALSFSLYNNDR